MNARSRSRAVVICALIILGACSPAPNRFPNLGIPMQDSEPDMSRVSITLDRSPGLAGAPSYEVKISGTGRGTFTGRCCAVVTEGEVDIAFDPKELLPVLDLLERMDFAHIDHHCDWGRSENDLPIASVGLSIDGRTTTFRSCSRFRTVGEGDDHDRLHASFDLVVAAIDRIDGIEKLVGTPDEVLELMRIRYEKERRRK